MHLPFFRIGQNSPWLLSQWLQRRVRNFGSAPFFRSNLSRRRLHSASLFDHSMSVRLHPRPFKVFAAVLPCQTTKSDGRAESIGPSTGPPFAGSSSGSIAGIGPSGGSSGTGLKSVSITTISVGDSSDTASFAKMTGVFSLSSPGNSPESVLGSERCSSSLLFLALAVTRAFGEIAMQYFVGRASSAA